MNTARTILALLLAGHASWALAEALDGAVDTPSTAPAADANASNKPAHVSPYALAARRHALAAANAPLLVIPPSQRRTRLVSGQAQH